MNYARILRLEGILLTGAGVAHLIYCAFFLDWSAFPLPLNLGGVAFGLVYTFFGARMALGNDRLILLTLLLNMMGLTGVLITGDTSPLAPIDPYLLVVDLVSVPTLIWLNVRAHRRQSE